ncbi:hypothetical protein FQA39_LY12369 [Lamprigera yunnana]|nr:hypothetical protein FQA39_LY12369 [Lamprigera yunnana]
MKLFFLVALIHLSGSQKILPHLTEAWTNVALPHSEECIAESGVDPIVAYNVFHSVPVDVTDNLRCYLKCVVEKLNFLLPNQEFDTQKYYDAAPDIDKSIIKECVDSHIEETDICAKVFTITLCIMQIATV